METAMQSIYAIEFLTFTLKKLLMRFPFLIRPVIAVEESVITATRNQIIGR